MKTLRILVLIFSMVSLWANSQSKAATDLPNLTEGLPDLTGSYMDLNYTYNYDAGSGAFVADGWTTDYNTSSGDVGVSTLDSYILSATINNGGNLTSGTLTIKGGVVGGGGDVTLLTGNLTTGPAGTAFGYGDGNNEIFQFLFTVNGGTLESAFGGNGTAGGVILSAAFDATAGDAPFIGSWTNSFNNNGSDNGAINAFTVSAVPEPSSILLVSAGVLCMVACRRLNALRAITS